MCGLPALIICVHILNSDQLSPIRWQTCGNAPLTSVRKQNTNSCRVRILTRSIKRSNYIDQVFCKFVDHPHLCSGSQQAPLVVLFPGILLVVASTGSATGLRSPSHASDRLLLRALIFEVSVQRICSSVSG